jgi:hypothetical protein
MWAAGDKLPLPLRTYVYQRLTKLASNPMVVGSRFGDDLKSAEGCWRLLKAYFRKDIYRVSGFPT